MSKSLRHTMHRSLAALIASLLLFTLFGSPAASANPFLDGYPKIGSSSEAVPGHPLIVGDTHYRTHLFPLHTGPGSGVDQYAYCIEFEVSVIYGIDLFTGPWSEFPGENNFATDDDARRKVAWIVRNSYPQIDLDAVRTAAGIPGLTEKEAIAGTQAAIWEFTNSGAPTLEYSYEGIVVEGQRVGPDGSPEAMRVTALVDYLTGPANGGRAETSGPSISMTATDGEAGGLVGPIHISGSEETVRVDGELPYPLVTGAGTVVDLSAVPTGVDLFLDVPADARAGSASISAELTGPTSTGLLLYNTRPRTQTLMIALSDEATVSAEASLSWAATPQIRTHASVEDPAGSHLPEDAPATVVDEVTYERLIPGQQYTVAGELMIREPDGSATASGITAERTFTPDEQDGTVTLEFEVPAAVLAGRVVVVFEHLFLDGIEVAAHTDITDRAQTVYSPAISTRAYNLDAPKADLPHTGGTLADEVSYRGLEVGQPYTLTGQLMDRDTGVSTGITGSTTFTPDSQEGTTLVEFTVPPERAGRTLVVYERLHHGQTQDGPVVATHEDLDDENQTVAVSPPPIPEIGTSARDGADGDSFLHPDDEAVVIDTVTYVDLLAGREYTVSGELMIKHADGSAESSGITAEHTFVPEHPDGTVDLEFTIPAGQLSGTVVVVFEHLFLDGIEVAAHADITDRAQTVFRPRIETYAYNIDDPEASLPYRGGTIQDRVSYWGLKTGEEYRTTGELMDRESGEATGITGEATFTPESPDGHVMVDFIVPEGHEGSRLVVFERLYTGDLLLATHEDLGDERQTVTVDSPPTPEIRTHARDGHTGGSFLPEHGEAIVIDTVTYTGLWPGKEYTMAGELMAKTADGGQRATGIVAEHTFTPETESGQVELEFIVPEGELQGEVLVVFEHLLRDGTEVAAHADITDRGQTVYRPHIDTFAYEIITRGKILPTEGGTLRDEVSYAGLKPGETYIMRGAVMSHETGEETGITAETTFIAEDESGTVMVDFVVPEGYASETLVVFERLHLAPAPSPEPRRLSVLTLLAPLGQLLATHEDLDDEEQTTTVADVPKIRTQARNGDSGGDYLPPTDQVDVIDTVTYESLITGREYTVAGELMIREPDGSARASGITAERTFRPETSDGQVELVFTIPASELVGEVIVVFERLHLEGRQVAVHTEINDRDQTVFRPHIETDAYNLTDPDGDLPHAGGTLQDQVTYAGLEAGATYTLRGELMDHGTGRSTGIVEEVTFTAEASEGTQTVDFQVPEGYAGSTLVVFERLLLEGEVIAVHEDLDDERQTVRVEEIPPPPPAMPPSGATLTLGTAAILLTAAGSALLIRRRFTL